MLEVGKRYRSSKDDQDVQILAKLPKTTPQNSLPYLNYAVFFVDRLTAATEPGELSVREDQLGEFTEVKE